MGLSVSRDTMCLSLPDKKTRNKRVKSVFWTILLTAYTGCLQWLLNTGKHADFLFVYHFNILPVISCLT